MFFIFRCRYLSPLSFVFFIRVYPLISMDFSQATSFDAYKFISLFSLNICLLANGYCPRMIVALKIELLLYFSVDNDLIYYERN